MTPSPSVAQEMPSENSIEIDLNQTFGLLDEEITNAKDTMAKENEEQHIDENIPATQNDVEISVTLDRDYSSDCAYFPSTIASIVLKGAILAYGSCRPTGPFPESEKDGRPVFSAKHYTIISKGVMIIIRDWLCYSPKLKAPYCQRCWLFADRSNARLQWSWINGNTGSSRHLCEKYRSMKHVIFI